MKATTTQVLTFAIAALATIASAGGLFIPNLYRDSPFYKTAWQANDTVTLLLIPALIASHHLSRQGDQRAKVIWLGLVAYMFYNYAFYLFGAVFNWFFVVYASLLALALYTFILGLFEIDKQIDKTPWVKYRYLFCTFFLFTALPLGIVELEQYISFIVTGDSPEIPSLILALDLGLVVPSALLAATLLARKHPWGYWLGGIMLVKSLTYGMVLITGTLAIVSEGVGTMDPLLPFYIFICAGGLIFLVTLLRQKGTRHTL